MRLATIAGLYVAVLLSAQIGAQKLIRLRFTHLVAPGAVYSIAPVRERIPDGVRVFFSAGASAPIDSFVFLVLAFGWAGLHFFDGQLVGKIASSVVIGIPLVVLGRRFLPANRRDIVTA